MENLLFIFKSILGFITGCLIGLAFGFVQRMAKERYNKMQSSKNLTTPIPILPGSLKRTVLFLLVLLIVQLIMPSLFVDDVKWLVSGGVVAGYAVILLDEIRKNTAFRKV